MSTETTPTGSFDAVNAMMGILSEDEPREAEESQAEQGETVATEEVDDEVESDDDEAEEVEQPTVRTFKVKVDGEEIEVPEDELLKGYSRTQDYTKKTQALAEQRKAAEQEYESIRAERAQYAQLVNQLAAKLQDEPQIDDSLQYTDPIAYAQQVAQVMQVRQQRAAVAQEQQRLAQVEQQEQAQQLQRYVAEQAELLPTLIPDWVDAETAKAEKAKIRDVAKSFGYSDDEVSQIYDARAVAVLRDAMRWREAQAKRQEIKPQATPVVKARPKATASAATSAKQRLAKTGSVNDAAAYFRTIL